MSGPRKRREKEKEQRRRAILKAARKLFFKKESHPVTVAKIAKKAQLSKGAIYLYFSSKEEIYAQLLLDDIEKFHIAVSDIFDKNDNASDILQDFSATYINFFLSDRELFRILMNFMLRENNLDFTSETHWRVIQETNRVISVTERIFQHGVDRGEFFIKEEDMWKARNALWGLLNGVLSLHLYIGKESLREERIRSNIEEGLKIFIQGLKKSL
ncbi:MAG: TetR/AcrR family transcriptional regulator [Deltaproteobacteria bacterium]|nr:TetR/AcrR family transcriptional regulator [Deltaproteobacteria bacterium]